MLVMADTNSDLQLLCFLHDSLTYEPHASSTCHQSAEGVHGVIQPRRTAYARCARLPAPIADWSGLRGSHYDLGEHNGTAGTPAATPAHRRRIFAEVPEKSGTVSRRYGQFF
jgi:hypothetical protein